MLHTASRASDRSARALLIRSPGSRTRSASSRLVSSTTRLTVRPLVQVPEVGPRTQGLGWAAEGGPRGNATAEDPEDQGDLSAHEQADEQTPPRGVAPPTRPVVRTPPPEQVGGEEGGQNDQHRG